MKSTNTLRSSLLKVKQVRPDRIAHFYTYNGKTGRTLEKQLSEHKTAAIRSMPPRIGLQFTPGQTSTMQINWEEERGYWKRRALEALHIHQSLDCSCVLTINPLLYASPSHVIRSSALWCGIFGCISIARCSSSASA